MLGLLTGRLYLLPWWHHHPSEEKLSGWQGWPTVCPCQAEGTWRQWVWSLRDMFTNTHNHKVRCGAWTAHYTSYGIRSCDTSNSRNGENEHKFKAMVDTPEIVKVAGHDLLVWEHWPSLLYCRLKDTMPMSTAHTCHMSTPHTCHMSTPHTMPMSTPHTSHVNTPRMSHVNTPHMSHVNTPRMSHVNTPTHVCGCICYKNVDESIHQWTRMVTKLWQ